MLRQIEWWVQNEPITKNGVLPVTTLYFWKFCFSLRTSYKEMIWCTNNPNPHIRTFCRRWNFIWRYFFPVSILKRVQFYYLIVRNWRSHWLFKFSFGNIAVDPSMMMMNCFCGMVDRRRAFSLISSRDHCQRSSSSRISDTPRAEFEPAQNLSSGLVEWSCAVVISSLNLVFD